MDYDAVLAHVLDLLQREQRVAYRVLRRFRKKKIPDYAVATGRIRMSHFGKRG